MSRFLLFAALAFPSLALAAPRTFSELADLVTNLINGGIGVALILGIVVYFYGISTSMHKTMGGEMSHIRTQLVWGILALFVMFSVWGILGLIRNTLFDGGATDLGGGDDFSGEVLCQGLDDCEITDFID